MEHKYIGIILKKMDVGEADRIYTIYTLENGKIRSKAQGVKKSKSRLASSLENFNLSHISIAQRRGNGRITGAITENNFPALRGDFESLAAVFQSAGIFDRLVGQEEKDEKIFRLLSEYLEVADKVVRNKKQKEINFPKLLRLGFVFKLLELLGYGLETVFCPDCREKLKAGKKYFSPERGGILCEHCAGKVGRNNFISENNIKIIRLFSANRIGAFLKLRVSENDLNNLEIVLNDFLRWIE